MPTPPPDIRMKGFAHRVTVDAALAWIDRQHLSIPTELVLATTAAGRVLSEDVRSRVNVPGFAKAMMDGFAIQANSSLGSSPYNPQPLSIVGEALPGTECPISVTPSNCVRIMTGAPMPAGADAVVPVEYTEHDEMTATLLDQVPPGKHVAAVGEDVTEGAVALHRGRQLRPQDIGLLASVGVREVQVRRKVRVRIVVTGNELLPPGSIPTGPQIVDSNSPMVSALVVRDGGIVLPSPIVPDQPDAILAAMQDDADVILVSGGSSVGQEDHAPRLLAEHGELAIHGVAMRPSSPSGMGRLGSRLVFLLPGNPVSCLCAYDFFAGRAIRAAGGRPIEWPYRAVRLPLARKISSMVGRVDYARVRIDGDQVTPIAVSGASLLSSTTWADGFVVIPADSEGYAAETLVDVYRYD